MAFADRVRSSWLRDDIVEALDEHRRRRRPRRARLGLLRVYLRPARRPPRRGRVIGTELVVGGDGRCTGALDGGNCRGAAKVVRLHRWLDQRCGGRRTSRCGRTGTREGTSRCSPTPTTRVGRFGGRRALHGEAMIVDDVLDDRGRPIAVGRLSTRRGDRAHGTAVAVDQERPRVRRPRGRRSARRLARVAGDAAHLRRLLPRVERHLPVERRPRRRRRPPPPDEAACARSLPDSLGIGTADSPARRCSSPPALVAAATGRWQTVAVVVTYVVDDDRVQRLAQARRRRRPRARRLGLRAASRRRRRRRRRPDVEVVRAVHGVRLAVHRHRQALRRAASRSATAPARCAPRWRRTRRPTCAAC